MRCRRAGFVLTGGRSSRMGSDKALLPWRGAPLAGHVALLVCEAAGSATLVGAPERYAALNWPAIPDLRPGEGPLAGLEAALRAGAEWNLVAACDMPNLTAELLRELLDAAERSGADCLVPEADGRLQPLCAVYHARCLAPFAAALDAGTRRMGDALARVRLRRWPAADALPFANMNNPEDFAQHQGLAGNPR